MFKRLIESARLRTSLSLRQLLGSDVLGDIPGTEVDETGLTGRDTISEHPVRIETFAGAGRHFPLVATSMVLSTISTVFILSALPASATSGNNFLGASLVARIPALHHQVTNRPTLTPLQARALYMQQLHNSILNAAATGSGTSSSAASSQQTAPASSSEMSVPLPASSSEVPMSSGSSVSAVSSGSVIRSDNKVGVYLTASSVGRKDFFRSIVDGLAAASGSAIVIDVKGGAVLFHSGVPMANDLALVKPFYELPDILKQLHDRGIYVIGRFVSIKDAGFTGKRPETKIRDSKGKILSETWVDPGNELAIEYNMQVICELAEAGIDEINLDYIRFSTAEFGALGVYTAEEKADRVEKFIKAAHETINRCGAATKLGLSTFAILGWDYDTNVRTLGQDVVRFAPFVDVISPMAYPATFKSPNYYVPGRDPGPRDYYLVYRTLRGYVEKLGPDQAKKIRPWIQGYGVSAKDVTDEMRGVYDAGFCGFTVWNAGNYYKPAFQAIKTDKLRPARCLDAAR